MTAKQREDLQKHWAFSRSRKAFELYVTGVKLKMTEEHLRDYFTCFGEVLDIFMHLGWCYIALRPAVDPTQILEAKHFVQGSKVNVQKCVFFGQGKIKHVRTNQTKKSVERTLRREKVKRRVDLQNHLAIARARKAVDLCVDGVDSKMSKAHLRTHFASFGAVFGVHMLMDYSINKSCGRAFIAMQPTVDLKQIFGMEHIVNGVRIRVKKYTSFLDVGNKPVRTEGNLNPEPLPPKQKDPRPAKGAHQLLQQCKNERKGQIHREKGKQGKIARQLQRLKQTQKQNQKRRQQQRQKGLQEHRTVGRPHKSLQLFVSGTKRAIIPDVMKAYFAHFGEVLHMNFPLNHSTEQQRGSCYITLQPTENVDKLFDRDHFICGARITVVECYSPDNVKPNAMGISEGISSRSVKLEPPPTEKQLEMTKQNIPYPREPFHAQKDLPMQQTDVLKQRTPEKLLKSCVDCARAEIIAEGIKAYFARFGEIPDAAMFRNL